MRRTNQVLPNVSPICCLLSNILVTTTVEASGISSLDSCHGHQLDPRSAASSSMAVSESGHAARPVPLSQPLHAPLYPLYSSHMEWVLLPTCPVISLVPDWCTWFSLSLGVSFLLLFFHPFGFSSDTFSSRKPSLTAQAQIWFLSEAWS